jgi:ribosome-associated heat shock protein Hsp15
VDKVRVDKWLWAARMYKTRSMASDACTGGHVQVNGEPAKPSVKVCVGDMVDARTPGGMRNLEVMALGDKRGPAKVAVTLYTDHTPPPEPTIPGDITFDRGSRKGRKGARITKKDRRKFDRGRDR